MSYKKMLKGTIKILALNVVLYKVYSYYQAYKLNIHLSYVKNARVGR